MFWLGPLLSQLTKYLPSWNCLQKQGNLSNQVYSMWVSSCDKAISILSCKDWRTHWLDSIGLHQRSTAVITRWNTWMCKHNKVGNLKILNNQLYMNNRLWSPLQELFFKVPKSKLPQSHADALDKPCFLCWLCALLLHCCSTKALP